MIKYIYLKKSLTILLCVFGYSALVYSMQQNIEIERTHTPVPYKKNLISAWRFSNKEIQLEQPTQYFDKNEVLRNGALRVSMPIEICCCSTILKKYISKVLKYKQKYPEKIEFSGHSELSKFYDDSKLFRSINLRHIINLLDKEKKVQDIIEQVAREANMSELKISEQIVCEQAKLFSNTSEIHRIVDYILNAHALGITLMNRIFIKGLAYALTNSHVLSCFAHKNAEAYISALQRLPKAIRDQVLDQVLTLKEEEFRELLPQAGYALHASIAGNYIRKDWNIQYEDFVVTIGYKNKKKYMFSATEFTLIELLHILALGKTIVEYDNQNVPHYFSDIVKDTARMFWCKIVPMKRTVSKFQI